MKAFMTSVLLSIPIVGCETMTEPELLTKPTRPHKACLPQKSLHLELLDNTPEERAHFQRAREQLAPTFFEDMELCGTDEVALISAKHDYIKALEKKGSGYIREELNAKTGNCEWRDPHVKDGALDRLIMQCHFHSAPEFVAKAQHMKFFGKNLRSNRDDIEAGEIHCIFPDQQGFNPTVYGMHIKCRAGSINPTFKNRECHSDILDLFKLCKNSSYHCCDRGTLTNPVGSKGFDPQIRPNFKICADYLEEVDCRALGGMHAHTSNAVDVGPEYEGLFLGNQRSTSPAERKSIRKDYQENTH